MCNLKNKYWKRVHAGKKRRIRTKEENKKIQKHKRWREKEDGKKEKGKIDDGKKGESNLTVTIVFTFENFVVLKAMVMLPTKSSKKW